MLIQRLVGMELLRSINLRGLGNPAVVKDNVAAGENTSLFIMLLVLIMLISNIGW